MHRLGVLSGVLADNEQVDRAAAVAGAMLDQAEGMESRRIRDRIVQVREQLRPYETSSAAREICQRIDEKLIVPF